MRVALILLKKFPTVAPVINFSTMLSFFIRYEEKDQRLKKDEIGK